jgi:hypothetical protein
VHFPLNPVFAAMEPNTRFQRTKENPHLKIRSVTNALIPGMQPQDNGQQRGTQDAKLGKFRA